MEVRFIHIIRDILITLAPLVLNVVLVADTTVRIIISMTWLTIAFFIVGCMDHPRRFLYAVFVYVLVVLVFVPVAVFMYVPFDSAIFRSGTFLVPMLIGTGASYWFVPPPRRPRNESLIPRKREPR